MASEIFGLTNSAPKPMQPAALTKKMDAAMPKRTALSQTQPKMSAVKVK